VELTVDEAGFRAWRKDANLYEPVYSLGLDIPGHQSPKTLTYIDKVPEE